MTNTPLPRVVACSLLLAPLTGAQRLHLVEDVNAYAVDNGTQERGVVTIGGWTYFSRDGAGVGQELHRAQVGTGVVELVLDIRPGPDGSRVDRLTAFNGALYFLADDGVSGIELWTSDGTAAGTSIVKDIGPGGASAFEPATWDRDPFVESGGRLWFAAQGAGDERLWSSDGTTAGTVVVPGNVTNPSQIVPFGAGVMCRAGFSQLYRCTVASGTALKGFYGGPNALVPVGAEVFFHAAETWAQGYELWKSDGTIAGTVLVKDIHPGTTVSESAYPSLMTDVGGTLLFSANDGTNGRELWTSDGTAAGTQMVLDIHPGSGGSLADHIRRVFAVFGGVAYFGADDGSGATLWRSDGTAAGTWPVVTGPAAPTVELLGSLPEGDVPGPVMYFSADDGISGVEPWKTDGTSVGTGLVADVLQGPGSSLARAFEHDGLGGAVFLAGTGADAELWRTGGTFGTTSALADDAVTDFPATNNANPSGVHDLFGRVVVAMSDGNTGHEPWAGDVASGYEPLADVNPGPLGAFDNADPEATFQLPLDGIRLGDQLVFLAHAGANSQVWATDGTPAGTSMLVDLGVIPYFPTYLYGVALEEVVVFYAETPANHGVWRTDGTAAGTYELFPIGTNSVTGFGRLGNEALFVITGSISSLAKTDGTLAGSSIVYGFDAPLGVWQPRYAQVGDALLFPATEQATGTELWRSDGTAAGTWIVKDLMPGPDDSHPEELTRVGDRVFFSADDGVAGRELWSSDGTTAGTTLAADLGFGSSSSEPELLTASGDRLFFAAGSSTNSLYVYEQGAAQLLKGFAGGNPSIQHLKAVGSRRVFFQANDGSDQGSEAWESDGTPAGTVLFEDFIPGFLYSYPSEFVLSGGDLYVAVSSPTTGTELRYAHVGATAQTFGTGCAASGDLPVLSADDPVIGGTSVLRVRDALPLSVGFAYHGDAAAPLAFGAGCEFYLSLAAFAPLVPVVTDANGSWDSAALNVPSSPAFAGAEVVMQAVLGPSGTPPFGLDLSSGVRLTLAAW